MTLRGPNSFLLSSAFEPLPPRLNSVRRAAARDLRVKSFTPSKIDVVRFARNGYVTTPAIVPSRTLRSLRGAARDVFSGKISTQSPPYEYDYWRKAVGKYNLNKDNTTVLKINNGWWVNQTLRDFVMSQSFKESIGATAAALLGVDNIALWHDQVIVKPPSRGATTEKDGVIGWHQDYAYWQISDRADKMITALVMLQPTSERNGCLQTAVGSHLRGLQESTDGGDPGFFTRDLEKTASALGLANSSERKAGSGSFTTIVKNNVAAGQVTFHHSLTFHGSGPNTSKEKRWALAFHMFSPEHCRLNVAKHHHNRRDLGPFQENGMTFAGDAFPLLYTKNRLPRK